jgi:hypothetical protein
MNFDPSMTYISKVDFSRRKELKCGEDAKLCQEWGPGWVPSCYKECEDNKKQITCKWDINKFREVFNEVPDDYNYGYKVYGDVAFGGKACEADMCDPIKEGMLPILEAPKIAGTEECSSFYGLLDGIYRWGIGQTMQGKVPAFRLSDNNKKILAVRPWKQNQVDTLNKLRQNCIENGNISEEQFNTVFKAVMDVAKIIIK